MRLPVASPNLDRAGSHFHMVGTDEVSYIRANSIHHSFQRAVTVHASNNVRVQDNFAYRIHGHCE